MEKFRQVSLVLRRGLSGWHVGCRHAGYGMRILVTGTSSGIGSVIAVRLAEHGHEVVAGARRVADAPAHPRIRPVELDVTDTAQLAAVAKSIGPLGGVVNNAGITFAGPLEHLPLDRLREQLEINVVGVVAVTQAFLPAIRAGLGRIVVIGSTSGLVTTPLLGAYSASKFAVEAVAGALRQELTPWGLPVVMVNPGSFASQNRAKTTATAEADRAVMGESAERQYGRAMDALVRFNRSVESRAGDPEQVAAVVERALTVRRPRPRYLVGADARMVVTMKRLLPARTVDTVLSRVMGLPRRPSD
ncbi:SDR family NAD(P)-dependent oxidoreductase [Streptomyces sp. NPDC000349]|uniref:SDR family NAD(P)-dependent oxidoreductase n=1 Tax=Streptomyces sp. NPDC000349 TaxID=3154249 RepID=UPI00336A5206